MSNYELALVVSAKIEEEARAQVVTRVQDLITRFGGTVTGVEDWGKKRTAYEIQKTHEAYYCFIQFDADSTVPAELESRLRIMENVYRFLCIKKEA